MISLVTIVDPDYDEAIAHFTEALGFTLVEDRPVSPAKRWVVVRPAASAGGASVLLAKGANELQRSRVGSQTGDRVAFFLETYDFDESVARMRRHGVEFLEEPRTEVFGRVVQFRDRYGNRWDLIQRSTP
ncbi:MAG: VOC family protein [Gemmatimonadetes bacterium]|nr:VOC family protein [Gemmatimonadota bacterium]MBI3567960.1 VOC family protein [Gemmatimonadota bacterium]